MGTEQQVRQGYLDALVQRATTDDALWVTTDDGGLAT
jgi:hypothetical protein